MARRTAVDGMHKKRKKKKRKTPKAGQTVTIKPTKKGQKPLKFKSGGLHKSTGTKGGKKISAKKHAAARSGKLGKKAKKQELFYQNVLKKGQKTAAKNRRKKK